jgi:hypothetical protein
MAVDYEALAKQFGGSAAPAPAPASDVDYEALAKQFGGAISAAEPTPAARTNVRDESFLRSRVLQPAVEVLATGQGISKGIGDIMFGGQRLVGQGLQALGAQQTGQALIEDAARRKAMEEANVAKYREVAPGAVPVGEFVGQTVATLPAGGLIGKGLQAASPALAPLAQAVRTGGFSTGMAPGAANIATKAAGGAILGGTSAALINPEEATTGAAIGAAAPFVLPTVGRYIAQGGGKIVDAFTGKLAEVKAGKVAREMAGDAINTIRAANNVAPMDVNAAQAVGGVDNDVYQAFLDFYAGKDKTSFQRVLKDEQKLGQLNQLARLAGGSTETEVINNISDAKRVLNRLTTPMREEVFGKVTETGQVMPALAKESKALRKEAADRVADVRRFAGQQVSKPTNVTPGLFDEVSISPAAQARAITPAQDNLATDYLLGKLAGSADEVAGKAAFDSLAAGQGARTAEAKLATMNERGLQPLAGSTLASKIEAIASQPGVRADTVQSKALLNLRDKVAELSAPSNGLIDVEDVYQIRKTSINDAINKALSESGYDPAAQSQRLAGLLGDVRGLIDDAIRNAGGGEDWNRYLETFSKGRGQLDQRLAAGQLVKILDTDPQRFVDIVKGRDPDFVEKIFGPGNRDIMQAMGGQRPNSPMVKLLGIADQAERDLDIKPQIKAGRKALNLEDQYGNPTELIPGFVGYKTAVAKKIAQMVTGKVNEKAQRLITEGVRSGKAMNEILNTLPAEERLKVIDLFRNNPDVQRAVSIGAVQYATPNALAPQQQNVNALAR